MQWEGFRNPHSLGFYISEYPRSRRSDLFFCIRRQDGSQVNPSCQRKALRRENLCLILLPLFSDPKSEGAPTLSPALVRYATVRMRSGITFRIFGADEC